MDTYSGRRLRPAFVIWFVALTIPTIAYASAEVASSNPPPAQPHTRAVVFPRYEPVISISPAPTETAQTLRESLMLALHRRYLRVVARQKHLAWVTQQRQKKAAAEQAAREAEEAAEAAEQQTAPPDLPPLPPPSTAPLPDWYAIAACESGGDWSVNTGNGFWGGLQFLPSTWFEFGGGPFSGSGAFPYSAAAQISVAERVLAGQGPEAWPNCFQWR
jgi:hypothetical protein